MLIQLSSVNVLNNDKLEVDFKPLFQCIHIYDTLGLLEELRNSYQADRKVFIVALSYYLDLLAYGRHNQI